MVPKLIAVATLGVNGRSLPSGAAPIAGTSASAKVRDANIAWTATAIGVSDKKPMQRATVCVPRA